MLSAGPFHHPGPRQPQTGCPGSGASTSVLGVPHQPAMSACDPRSSHEDSREGTQQCETGSTAGRCLWPLQGVAPGPEGCVALPRVHAKAGPATGSGDRANAPSWVRRSSPVAPGVTGNRTSPSCRGPGQNAARARPQGSSAPASTLLSLPEASACLARSARRCAVAHGAGGGGNHHHEAARAAPRRAAVRLLPAAAHPGPGWVPPRPRPEAAPCWAPPTPPPQG